MKKYLIISFCTAITLCGVGLIAGHSLIKARLPEPEGFEREQTRSIVVEEPEYEWEATPEPIKIHDKTKIVYEYHYKGDNHIESSTEEPPYFLMNLTESDLRRYFTGWEIIEFTENQVVLRKTIQAAANEHYVLGVKDDYVAVYFRSKSGEVSLKEITAMPLTALSYDEQRRLIDGIKIEDEISLSQILEDYGS
ncbi:MAG: hypothetical protein LBQ68_02045 [Clostridiales bacterium]|nr:hypothetical protein [Clostridiales bacterium]